MWNKSILIGLPAVSGSMGGAAFGDEAHGPGSGRFYLKDI
jgi:hypothetical protein